jgi:uncharacterized protein (DUF1778 family)
MPVHVKGFSLESSGNFPYTVRMPKETSDTKTARFELRLTEAEKELYQRAADQDGRPVANWMRDRLQRTAKAELEEDAGVKGKSKRPSP